ncbi:hypothetical protein RIF29_18975 [Crotalaria pallida]|uniref:Uncharacterized protein n=1 Tax=Crotalaria pallida TaxID=3830 RepID=A0AAN9I536_CROPI
MLCIPQRIKLKDSGVWSALNEMSDFGVFVRTAFSFLQFIEGIQSFVTMYHWDLPQMLDDKYEGWIKLGLVKLAKKYMKRVAMELQAKSTLEKDPTMDYMLIQGVRFAFRIHQVCPESMLR